MTITTVDECSKILVLDALFFMAALDEPYQIVQQVSGDEYSIGFRSLESIIWFEIDPKLWRKTLHNKFLGEMNIKHYKEFKKIMKDGKVSLKEVIEHWNNYEYDDSTVIEEPLEPINIAQILYL